ncbi:ATP-binding cassette domain-containing protein [Niallia sp. 01092]|uniref:ATP-binding cassette domain-containing protein n=1 Tax=unclassified Niallia TaxID=2837522 RepID=UPI003FD0C049
MEKKKLDYQQIKDWQLSRLLEEYSYFEEFFSAMALPLTQTDVSLQHYFLGLDRELLEDIGMDRNELIQRFEYFLVHMTELQQSNPMKVDSVTIIGGRDKAGVPETISLTMKTGEIVCVVGPTGSGKSRLLADLEWMAQGDTPTGRKILINNQVPPSEWRFSLEHKLVAQLSQNMNFVVDMTVEDFIKMHAESRMMRDPEEKTKMIIEHANRLAGEEFSAATPVTSLSGGQSRALMIADTAFLSISPIVLIDEIENAGIDRKKALELLVKKDKIVLMATHDPILALSGRKRVVIKNGGIHDVIESSPQEKVVLEELERLDHQMMALRNRIRFGERLDVDLKNLFEMNES